jgi:hypothetical protein
MTNVSAQPIEQAITATRVPDTKRLEFLPRHFGRLMLKVENYIYNRFRVLCPAYSGGYWEFHDLSNGGCYLAPSGERYHIVQPGNHFDDTVSADAAGIIITLYAMSELAFEYGDRVEVFAERLHQLREFASTHAEAALILRAID